VVYDAGKEFAMAETLTLDLPPDVARRARAVAAATNRRVEDVVVEWIGRGAAETPVETLPDADVLELTRSQLGDNDQAALSDLLGRQAELTPAERERLDGLLGVYRRGLVLKARAVKEAVARGLIPRLDGHAA
jgi:hypothetical protein